MLFAIWHQIPIRPVRDAVLAAWYQKGEGRESFDDCIRSSGSGKSLEQLLERHPGRDDVFAKVERWVIDLVRDVYGEQARSEGARE